MIKNNQQFLNGLHIAIDACIIAISYFIAYYLRFSSPLPEWFPELSRTLNINHFGWWPPFDRYASALVFIIPGYLVIYYCCSMYGPKRTKNRNDSLWAVIKSNAIGIIYFTFLMVLLKDRYGNVSRWFLVIFCVTNTALDFAFRSVLYQILRKFRKRGYNLKHVLVVGYSHASERYIKRLLYNPEWGYQIHGILDDNHPKGFEYRGVKVIGSLDSLSEMLAENTLDEIAITLKLNEYAKLEHIVGQCEKSGAHTKFIPDYDEVISSRPYTEDLFGLPVINIRKVPLTNPLNKAVKRIVDIFGAIVAILLFSIPMLIISIIIKVTSPGPLIFKQNRVGLHNREFSMYKFRSMEIQPPDKEKSSWTIMNDPRVTPIGKFIRKTSLDELPQFFNVLKGDMSLIGPRPERPFFVEKFKEEIPRYMIKHQVRPGITGWAQVNGYRGDTSIRLRIEHDLYYIENWTLSLDFKILFLTFFKGFVNMNAY